MNARNIPIKWGVGYGLAPEGRVCSRGDSTSGWRIRFSLPDTVRQPVKAAFATASTLKPNNKTMTKRCKAKDTRCDGALVKRSCNACPDVTNDSKGDDLITRRRASEPAACAWRAGGLRLPTPDPLQPRVRARASQIRARRRRTSGPFDPTVPA